MLKMSRCGRSTSEGSIHREGETTPGFRIHGGTVLRWQGKGTERLKKQERVSMVGAFVCNGVWVRRVVIGTSSQGEDHLSRARALR